MQCLVFRYQNISCNLLFHWIWIFVFIITCVIILQIKLRPTSNSSELDFTIKSLEQIRREKQMLKADNKKSTEGMLMFW